MVKSLLSFFKAASFSFLTSGYDSASDLLLDMKDLSWFMELLFLISESFCELRELFTLTSPCSLAFFSSSCCASSSFKYSSVYSLYFFVMSSFGVFTFPSTTTKLPSIYDWEVLVPLMGALSRLKPFLLTCAFRPAFWVFLFFVLPALRDDECSDCI